MSERYYRRSGAVASRVVGGEALLVKSDENKVYVLNAPGSRIWVNADGRRKAAELAGEWDPEQVGTFLEELVGLGLLEVSDKPFKEPSTFPQAVEWQEGADAEAPRIVAAEEMEVLASVCDSSFGGQSGCRTEGICFNAYT